MNISLLNTIPPEKPIAFGSKAQHAEKAEQIGRDFREFADEFKKEAAEAIDKRDDEHKKIVVESAGMGAAGTAIAGIAAKGSKFLTKVEKAAPGVETVTKTGKSFFTGSLEKVSKLFAKLAENLPKNKFFGTIAERLKAPAGPIRRALAVFITGGAALIVGSELLAPFVNGYTYKIKAE